MGINKKTRMPCGFCFVEYVVREDAARAIELLNKSVCDGRIIRVDWDIGFLEGRQYGRGKSGGQVRDEFRKDVDLERVAPDTGKKRKEPEEEEEGPKEREKEKDYRKGKYEADSK